MLPTDSVYPLLFVSGLLGGFGHCTLMCGPIAVSISLSMPRKQSLKPHLLYHMGRVTTYSLIGGAAGLAGSFLGIAEFIAPIRKPVAAGTGILIMLFGLAMGGFIPRFRPASGAGDSPGFPGRLLRFTRESDGAGAFYPLGLALGFLPCGLVYAALLSAARSGMDAGMPAEGFLRGFLAMAFFGSGTIGPLLIVAKAAGILGARMRNSLYRASAAMVAAAGAVFLFRALTG